MVSGEAAIAIARSRRMPPRAAAEKANCCDMGVEHVYDYTGIRRADPRRHRCYGVDVVLNSFARRRTRAGIELLAFGEAIRGDRQT